MHFLTLLILCVDSGNYSSFGILLPVPSFDTVRKFSVTQFTKYFMFLVLLVPFYIELASGVYSTCVQVNLYLSVYGMKSNERRRKEGYAPWEGEWEIKKQIM